NFEKFFCSNSSLHSKLVSKGLITDSGVNQHITYTDKNLIDVIDISYLKIKVTRPNRTEAFITRIENMPLTDYLTLYDVLVVPGYCVSLMSVHKVARDSKLVIAFDEMHCYVMNQDLRKGKILGTGKQIGRLYYYNGNQDYLPLLNRKSPYDLVYNKPPSLKHLRSFICLAYATILNSHDKFGSTDVKFFEDIFPFKQNNSTGIDNSVQDVNHLNFFNTNTLDDLPEIPNDEERRKPSPIRHGHSQDADASANENGSFASDEENINNFEGNGLHDQSQDNVSQDNNGAQNLRRSSRTSGVEPKTYFEASQHKHWVDAMNAEMDALYRNNTWEIIDLPVGRKAIGSKWGIDFDGTFSPVVKIVTVRCLINLVVQNGWSLFQMDINNAFLYDDLEETVYITLPPGYFPDNETKVCKLNKSLYDLKQAPRQWNAKLTAALLENNFVLTEIEKVKQFLKTKFMIKDLGKLKYFFGIEVLDTPKGICLNQRKYCLEFIDEFGLLAGKPSNLPMQPNISLTSEPSDTDPLLDNVTDQFMHNPLRSHLKTALKVTRYLKGSPSKGINVIKGSESGIDLKAYSDADWARCVDTRRSITGYCVFMCGSLVSWKSKKQNTISKSSTEAEYRALAFVTSKVIWILNIWKDLKCFNLLPVIVFCDNNSAIKIVANLIFHERTKHLEIDLHFVREKIVVGVIETVKIETANQIADILTRGLDTKQHNILCYKLGMTDLFQNKIKGEC
ncbi:putative RNA-directed DNA polymerase, partial [Tanacetum coccineum]